MHALIILFILDFVFNVIMYNYQDKMISLSLLLSQVQFRHKCSESAELELEYY